MGICIGLDVKYLSALARKPITISVATVAGLVAAGGPFCPHQMWRMWRQELLGAAGEEMLNANCFRFLLADRVLGPYIPWTIILDHTLASPV